MASQRIKGITIEIGGDTTKLVSALSKVDGAIKATKTNLNDINRALKLDPTNVNLLKDKQQELARAAEDAKTKLDTEKQALEQMKNTEGFDANSRAARDLQTQIDLDTVALQQAEKELKNFGTVGAQEMQAVGAKLEETGTKISGVGKSFTTHVTAPIAAGFTAVIKTTADFDSQMSKVQAISGASAEQMNALRDKARDMGATTKFSATEAGEAMEYMAMAGWKTEDMLNGVTGIMNLAAASGEELGTTSDIVTDALTAFGMSAQDSGRFADILAAAATNANTNVSMMGESFKYAAPAAGTLGYSAEDVAAALGLMANSGIKADMAGTSLRNMFNRMAKPTKESRNAMIELGLSLADSEGNAYSFREIMDQIRTSFSGVTVDLDKYNESLDGLDAMLQQGEIDQSQYDELLKEINVDLLGSEGAEKARLAAMLGGTRAMSGLLAIANATEEDYTKLTSAIDGSSEAFAKLADGSVVPLSEALASGQEVIETYNGAAEAMAQTMENNLSGDLTVLKSALQELAISLGELLIPLARDIVGVIQNVVNWLNSLDEDTKKTILTIAAVAAAIGPILIVIGNVISAIGTITSAIGAVTNIISFLIPIITTIGSVITGTIIPAIAAIGAPILGIVAAIAAVIAIIVLCVKHWDEIKEVASNVAEILAEKWEEFKTKISQIWDSVLTKIKTVVDNIKNSVSSTWQNIVNDVTTKVSNLRNNVTNAFNNLKSSVVNTFENIKNNAVNAFNNLRNSISNTVGNIRNSIVNGFQNAISFITSLPSMALGWGADIINGIVDGIYNAFHNLVSAVSDIADTIASYIHFSEPDKGALANFHTFMPDMMKQLTQGIYQGMPQLENAMNTMTQSMVPSLEAGETTNTTNTVSVNVYGAQGQDVNELAQIIEDKITNNVVRRGVAFG